MSQLPGPCWRERGAQWGKKGGVVGLHVAKPKFSISTWTKDKVPKGASGSGVVLVGPGPVVDVLVCVDDSSSPMGPTPQAEVSGVVMRGQAQLQEMAV